jgi:hypothetical protein
MSTLRADTIQNTSGGAVTLTNQSAAKAWCNFSGNTATIRDSLNAASLTDSGGGQFDVNHTNNMGNINYSVQVTSSYGATDVGGADGGTYINGIGTIRRVSGSTSTSALKIVTGYDFGTFAQDHAQSMTLAHGDLA